MGFPQQHGKFRYLAMEEEVDAPTLYLRASAPNLYDHCPNLKAFTCQCSVTAIAPPTGNESALWGKL